MIAVSDIRKIVSARADTVIAVLASFAAVSPYRDTL
jgi:hypothetical protein